MANYIIHSQGAWKEHKYVKKIGDEYFYSSDNKSEASENDVKATNKEEAHGRYLASKFKGSSGSVRKSAPKSDMFKTGNPKKGTGSSSKDTSEKEVPSETKAKLKTELGADEKTKVSYKKHDDGSYSATIKDSKGKKKTVKMDKDGKIIKDEIKHSAYLVHHGILGMKWGLRRYQNEDGTLTDAGKKRYNIVSESSLRQKIDTANAKTILKNKSKEYSSYSVSSNKLSEKYLKKSEKYSKGSLQQEKMINKSNEYKEKQKEYEKASSLAAKKYKDIESGKLIAGRDFIVQRDLNVNITRFPFYMAIVKESKHIDINKITTPNYWLGSNEYRIIDKE